jgi:peptide-methionine (S)-S-oxide reductase
MRARLLTAALLLLLLGGRAGAADPNAGKGPKSRTAIFAGGCFWCIEADFEKLPGVLAAESGYTAGRTSTRPTNRSAPAVPDTPRPSASATTRRRSAMRNCSTTSGDHIDPTVKNRQFCDIGSQYRSGIYWQNDAERKAAESSRDALLASGKLPRIETEIVAASAFYPAEEYHQDYYKKNPIRYAYYRLLRPRRAAQADLGRRRLGRRLATGRQERSIDLTEQALEIFAFAEVQRHRVV